MFFGPVVNAARAIAFQIQGAVALFLNNFVLAVRPQVVKSYADNDTGRMYNLTFSTAKYSYMLMLALVLPLCFEIRFVLKIWLGPNVPENTDIFAVIVLITYLMESFHVASLMSYHAIGKIKLGNIVGGTMMILALPISYVLLKIGLPAYSVFIAIFVINFIQMFWGWWIVHHYVPFSYWRLLKTVYVPAVIVTIISVAAPSLILHSMNEGWKRFLLLFFATETIFLITVFFIGLNRDERNRLISVIAQKIRKQ
jgi:O-antigen/teichoic acid export membrane protein